MESICGKAELDYSQLLAYFKTKNSSPKLTCTIEELIQFYYEEGEIENIRADVAFAQACLETGFFKYGGIVNWNQNNFCGLGALDGNANGKCATFENARIGVRAQIQHLKAYATDLPLVQKVVDPRFNYPVRNSAKYVEHLGIQENPLTVIKNGKTISSAGWATRKGYGNLILGILNGMSKFPKIVKPEDIENTTSSEPSSSDYTVYLDDIEVGLISPLPDSRISISLELFKKLVSIENIDDKNRKIHINKGKVEYVRC